MTTPARTFEPTAPAVRQHELSTLALLVLHLAPGVLMTAGFIVLAPAAEALGFPPIAALLAAIVLVLVPIEIGVLSSAARRDGVTIAGLIPWRRPIPGRTWAWLVPTLIVVAFLGFGLHQAIEPALIDRFFSWLPEWYVTPLLIERISDYGAAAWITTLIAYVAINGFVGPIVEELYFRGYLLPRMERFGRAAPWINVGLFSLYHLWSPWQVVARIVGLGPTVVAVRQRRNIYLGMAVHCTLNTLGVLLVAGMVIGRL
jgi:uncharacterized protein